MMSHYNFIGDLTTLAPEIPKDSIVSRTFHEDERLKVILFGFAEGQELSEHTASQPAMLQFISTAMHTIPFSRLRFECGSMPKKSR